MSRMLGRIDDPITRATKSHDYIESYMSQIMENDVVKKSLACGNGCSACCHTQVSINSDEAELLSQLVIDGNAHIDLKKLYIQGNVENDPAKWFQLPYTLRGCVFLDEKGSCTIYENRPIVCRTNNVLGEASQCDTRDGVEKPLRLLNTHKSDIVTIAAYNAAGKGGTLPHMLWESLREKVEYKSLPKRKKKAIKKAKLTKIKKNISKLIEL